MSPSRRRVYQLAALAISTAAIAAVLIAVLSSAAPRPLRPGRPVPGARAAIDMFAGIPQQSIYLGAPNAPVTLVEFADLQCPFCARFATHVLPKLVSRYVQRGRLRLIFRNLDGLGHDSVRAAQMAAAVGEQNHLWEFVDLAYRNQGEENSGYVTDDFLRAIAGVIPGVDVREAMRDRETTAVTTQLAQARALASSLNLDVTPSFLLYPSGSTPQRFEPSTLDSGPFQTAIDRLLSMPSQ